MWLLSLATDTVLNIVENLTGGITQIQISSIILAILYIYNNIDITADSALRQNDICSVFRRD